MNIKVMHSEPRSGSGYAISDQGFVQTFWALRLTELLPPTNNMGASKKAGRERYFIGYRNQSFSTMCNRIRLFDSKHKAQEFADNHFFTDKNGLKCVLATYVTPQKLHARLNVVK